MSVPPSALSAPARRELWLFTANHPYTHNGGEVMFVAPELPHLVQAFGAARVRLVPLHDGGQRLPLPEGVALEVGLARRWRRWRLLHLLRAPAWPGFLAELRRGWREGGPIGAARVWRWAAVADATRRWLTTVPSTGDGPRLYYTYWRGGQTLAALALADAARGDRVVTRVHRYELYAEAFSPPFQPWEQVYQQVACTFAIAAHGADYLRARGVPPGRVRVARLGVADPGVSARASGDGAVRLLSISNLIPVKRVAFTARALIAFARRVPLRTVHWTHYGDGPERAAVEAVLRDAPPNLHARLAGQVPNAKVLAHYREQPVDALLLLSASEGLPVSIQEALAAGVPVIATDVGGVGEAVRANGDNGVLLPAQAGEDGVVRALLELLDDPDETRRLARRRAARSSWRERFDAAENHRRFAMTLFNDVDA